MSVIKTISFAPEAWKLLNGIFAVYKPSSVSAKGVQASLRLNLCRDLNQLEKRQMQDMVFLKGSVCTNKPYEVEVVPNYADHELVSGPRYQERDLRMKGLCKIGYYTSGVFLIAVNDGCKYVQSPVYNSFLRKYEIKGKFGIATKNFMDDGIVFERSTYRHIKQAALDRILATIQSSHQALAFKYSGIDVNSQAGYEAAASGLVKPIIESGSLIYGIKCTEFNLPHFTLEVHCLNETEEFLAQLIYDIGVDLKSTAVCTQIRRTQFGHISIPHALLRKHWTLEHIINNLNLCRSILNQDHHLGLNFKSVRQLIQKDVIEDMQRTSREEELM